MVFSIPQEKAAEMFTSYRFQCALTPSMQKCAFHVQDSDGLDLCLKVISPDYEAVRLEREIAALRAVNHPNVVRFHEYAFRVTRDSQSHYIIEEFVPGNDLSELFTGDPWDLGRVAEFFIQFFEGLAELKANGLVHRDLKPTNVRVHTDGHPVIIDFGLVRHLNRSDLTLTAQGAGLGTPAYFAPEQFTGTKYDIDHRTDLFAAGILLYTALVGCHPFLRDGASLPELRDSVCNSEEHLKHERFTTLPRPWQLLVAKLLQKDRPKRINDPTQVASILKKLGERG